MSVLDKNLLADLFGASNSAVELDSNKQSPVKKKFEAQELTFSFTGESDTKIYSAGELKTRFSEYFTKLLLAGLSYSVTHDLPPRVEIIGENKEREAFMNRLRNEPETEALLILKAATANNDLRVAIEERAAMREYEAGLSGSVFLAVLGDIVHETERREFQPIIKPISWEQELKLMGIM